MLGSRAGARVRARSSVRIVRSQEFKLGRYEVLEGTEGGR